MWFNSTFYRNSIAPLSIGGLMTRLTVFGIFCFIKGCLYIFFYLFHWKTEHKCSWINSVFVRCTCEIRSVLSRAGVACLLCSGWSRQSCGAACWALVLRLARCRADVTAARSQPWFSVAVKRLITSCEQPSQTALQRSDTLSLAPNLLRTYTASAFTRHRH